MNRVSKTVPPKRQILKDISLSFFPGAKIGMVGPNGAGKSSILKIMAGIDQPSNGEARLSPGYSVGILMQEPELDEGKTVLGNVEEGVAEIKSKLDRYNEISAAMADPDADFDALMEEMGALQTEIDAANAWDLDSQLEQAMDALRCPPPDAEVKNLSGGERRRVALCKLLLEAPDLLLLDEPTTFLDIRHQVELMELLVDLNRRGRCLVAVLHDLNQAARFSTHLIAMRAGEIVAQGPPGEVVTPGLVEEVFGLPCVVTPDPVTGSPQVTPIGRNAPLKQEGMT